MKILSFHLADVGVERIDELRTTGFEYLAEKKECFGVLEAIVSDHPVYELLDGDSECILGRTSATSCDYPGWCYDSRPYHFSRLTVKFDP